MRTIAVMNQKGGVGKTTTAMNLAHALALAGNKVLAIDCDPQSHLSTSFGEQKLNGCGLDEVLLGEQQISEMRQQVRKNLDLVIAGGRLGEMEFEANGGASRGFRLKQALEEVKGKYDFILLDCPPSAGLLAMNCLFAAKELLIPVSSDYLAMHGLSRLLSIVEHIEENIKERKKKWLVITRFQTRRKLAREVKEKLLAYFPKKVLRTTVREAVALAESPSFGQTIFDYRKLSAAAQDYLALAADLKFRRTN